MIIHNSTVEHESKHSWVPFYHVAADGDELIVVFIYHSSDLLQQKSATSV